MARPVAERFTRREIPRPDEKLGPRNDSALFFRGAMQFNETNPSCFPRIFAGGWAAFVSPLIHTTDFKFVEN